MTALVIGLLGQEVGKGVFGAVSGAGGFVVGGSWGSGPWFLVWGRACGWFMCASAFGSACQTGLKEKTRLIRILYRVLKEVIGEK